MSDAFEATYEKFIPEGVLIYLSVRNKLLKQEQLLHNPSDKKIKMSSYQNTFFKETDTRQRGNTTSKTIESKNTALVAYFDCIKMILTSNINTEAKLELIGKIVEKVESSEGSPEIKASNLLSLLPM